MDVNDYFQAIFGYFLAIVMFFMMIVYLGLYGWHSYRRGHQQYRWVCVGGIPTGGDMSSTGGCVWVAFHSYRRGHQQYRWGCMGGIPTGGDTSSTGGGVWVACLQEGTSAVQQYRVCMGGMLTGGYISSTAVQGVYGWHAYRRGHQQYSSTGCVWVAFLQEGTSAVQVGHFVSLTSDLNKSILKEYLHTFFMFLIHKYDARSLRFIIGDNTLRN